MVRKLKIIERQTQPTSKTYLTPLILFHFNFFFNAGKEWTKLDLRFSEVDTGVTSAVWAVDSSDIIYSLDSGNWKTIPGKLIHVSAGQSGVWGVNRQKKIYYRMGIDEKNPSGKSWKRIRGSLKQIDSGPTGIVCGVFDNDNIYCRLQITSKREYGGVWKKIDGKLKYISCGDYGHWGVNSANQIYFREGVSRSRPGGLRWKRISGSLVQLEAGQYGTVWGVNANGEMYVREGVKENKPYGTRWKKIPSQYLWARITVGIGTLYGVDRFGSVYKGIQTTVGGKLPISLTV